MKTTFKIHISAYLFYALLLLAGYFNYLMIYFFIILMHELGHIIVINLFRIKIESITIYPFGGIIRTNINYNINSTKLLLISLAGIFMQIILFIIIPNTYSYNYKIFKILNLSLITYNLIPIYPSDGNKILTSILERFISYKNTLYLTSTISIVALFTLFYFNKSILLFVILYYMNINNILLIKYILNKFKLERYLYSFNYSKPKYIKGEDNMHKCRKNYLIDDNIYISEKEYLKRKFEAIY